MPTFSDVERQEDASTWTLCGKLFADMDDREVEAEALHWGREVKFYARAALEYGQHYHPIYNEHERMRYRNYVASKANWDRKHAYLREAREAALQEIKSRLLRRVSEQPENTEYSIAVGEVLNVMDEMRNERR